MAPVSLGGELVGRLWITGLAASPNPGERRTIERFALVVGVEVLKRRHRVEVEERLSGDLIADKPLTGLSAGTGATAGGLAGTLPTAIRRASTRGRPGTVVAFELSELSVEIGRATSPTGDLENDTITTIRRASLIGRPSSGAEIGVVDADATIEDHDTSAD